MGGPAPLSVKEAARTAEALALLVLPTVDNHAVSEKGMTIALIYISLLITIPLDSKQ